MALAAAKRHMVVLSSDGDIYTWGHRAVTPRRVQLAGTRTAFFLVCVDLFKKATKHLMIIKQVMKSDVFEHQDIVLSKHPSSLSILRMRFSAVRCFPIACTYIVRNTSASQHAHLHQPKQSAKSGRATRHMLSSRTKFSHARKPQSQLMVCIFCRR